MRRSADVRRVVGSNPVRGINIFSFFILTAIRLSSFLVNPSVTTMSILQHFAILREESVLAAIFYI